MQQQYHKASAQNFLYVVYYSPLEQSCLQILNKFNLEGISFQNIFTFQLEELLNKCPWITGVPIMIRVPDNKIYKGDDVVEELGRYSKTLLLSRQFLQEQEAKAKGNTLLVPISASQTSLPVSTAPSTPNANVQYTKQHRPKSNIPLTAENLPVTTGATTMTPTASVDERLQQQVRDRNLQNINLPTLSNRGEKKKNSERPIDLPKADTGTDQTMQTPQMQMQLPDDTSSNPTGSAQNVDAQASANIPRSLVRMRAAPADGAVTRASAGASAGSRESAAAGQRIEHLPSRRRTSPASSIPKSDDGYSRAHGEYDNEDNF